MCRLMLSSCETTERECGERGRTTAKPKAPTSVEQGFFPCARPREPRRFAFWLLRNFIKIQEPGPQKSERKLLHRHRAAAGVWRVARPPCALNHDWPTALGPDGRDSGLLIGCNSADQLSHDIGTPSGEVFVFARVVSHVEQAPLAVGALLDRHALRLLGEVAADRVGDVWPLGGST